MGRGLSQESKDLISASRRILEATQPTTVRSVCYRLFTEGLIESMSVKNTQKVGRLLTRAREEGLVPWEWIVDDGRRPRRADVWDAPRGFAECVNRSFRLDPWETQPVRVEVWSEKGTVSGVLGPILRKYAVTFRVNRGFASATSIMDMVTEAARDADRPLVPLYVGDFDPSGLYMSEVDLPRRLREYGAGGRMTGIERVALVAADLADLPSFDVVTKAGDPRFAWYWKTTGEPRAWELDAMDPNVEQAQAQSLKAAMDGWAALPYSGS
jgi:hypothetical protein